MLHRVFCAFIAVVMVGCADVSTDPLAEGEFIVEGDKEILDVEPGNRSVGFEYRGPKTSGLSSQSEVWTVSRSWHQVTNEPGMAWSSNSGLTWDEKYAAWVDLMGPVTGDDGHMTVELITPWGKKLPSPRLECAELAMFLRTAFASWYELPFFMSAYSSTSGTIFSGHFGVVDANGTRVTNTPRYGTQYTDHTASFAGRTNAYIVANWPSDGTLATKYLTSQKDDYNTFLGPDKYAGAYFDEVFLNKRVGHFLVRLLTWHGSMHLASVNNMWNLKPGAIRPGDVLLHRWQSQGIGHAMVIKEVEELGLGQLDAQFVFGSMPRIQPRWYSANLSKSYFTSDYAGSGALDSSGTAYSRLGGGVKRWRTPVVSNGYWTAIVPVVDRTEWIASNDYPAIEARPATFQQILGNLTPTEQRDVILDRIEIARANLRLRPASCANRQRREEAFDDLYALMSSQWGWSKEQVDRQYRVLDDYVLAELVYNQSKTCCWNSTTGAMYDIVMDYATEQAEDAEDADTCAEPVVFRARNGGYDPFRAYAHSTGRGAQWVEWSADEACPQSGVSNDTEESPVWSDFCDVVDSVMGWDACPNGNAPTLFYADGDGDNYGRTNDTIEACSRPAGYASSPGDCRDADRFVHPGAVEICDGIDNNCDGRIDEGCGTGDGGSTDPDPSGGGTDCGGGCDARNLSGPGPFALMLFTTFGFGLRRRRWA